jgi:hypothetical protein
VGRLPRPTFNNEYTGEEGDMANWGGLNNALTSWRNGINKRFPKRGTASDGGYADAAHGSNSQHQKDSDGTVDAFDCDVNFLGSSDQTGTATEDRIAEALKADFENDPYGRGQLWIHNYYISNRSIGPWSNRWYGGWNVGKNPHDHHIHFESVQDKEDDGRPWPMPRTDALLRELNIMPSLDNTDLANIEARMRAVVRQEVYAAIDQDKVQGFDDNGVALPEDPNDPALNDMRWSTALGFSVRFSRMVERHARLGFPAVLEGLQALAAARSSEDVSDDAALAQLRTLVEQAKADAEKSKAQLLAFMQQVRDEVPTADETAVAVVSKIGSPDTPDEEAAAVLLQLLGQRASTVVPLMVRQV